MCSGVLCPAMPLSSCKILGAGSALCHKCIHHLEQQGLSLQSSIQAPILMAAILITKISLERSWNEGLFCIPLDCSWLLATSNKLLGNKKQIENNRCNYVARWMFHFKYYCICEDIQHEFVIAKRNMHWSPYQETGMTVLCKYYFIYCQQL